MTKYRLPMNLRIKWTIILFTLFQFGLNGQNVLVTEVTGLKGLTGDLYFSLYDNESSWLYPDLAFRKVLQPVESDTALIILEDLPEGDYAIALFLDINENALMDETEAKIPREPYGFSNNPRGIRGPASYGQAIFHVDGRDTVRIEMINNIFTPNKEKNENKD